MRMNLRDDAAQRLIPGAYDPTTLTYRQPGSMGGAAFGSADMPLGPGSMDEATIAERELEGGGMTGGLWWSQLLRLASR